MSFLLDTCVFLWLIGIPKRLPENVRSLVERGDIPLAVSTASLWEVLIKHGKGQMGLDTKGETTLNFLVAQSDAHHIDILPILPHTLEPLERLPTIHRDLFDRLLICQAIEHGLTIITPDLAIRRYPIKTLWY
ncbi:MAG: type II toxin-antitoxin system VapC family toxin [Thiothrix sp.]|nr:MAG: type II toxin-antitoxin system VapC family toxin [Thiothrix sp.]